ncbi:hypothetical protein LAZ67_1004774 [Cordylochernes scorpioides]|uniref:Angiotensin-converting enzyme n=1 Tax=Cordylochernes scorpioides TaxID=51811 RepID=A0ABY6JYJ1_9ARAC|nr:hypothetical protein LAZ67_1004774 [Cordylochernes scorpioides]
MDAKPKRLWTLFSQIRMKTSKRNTKEVWRQATSFAWKNLTDPLVRRQFQKLAVLDDDFLPKEEHAEFFRIAAEMEDIYSQAKVDNLSLEPGSRDATGKKIRSQYIKFVELSNEVARANGKSGDCPTSLTLTGPNGRRLQRQGRTVARALRVSHLKGRHGRTVGDPSAVYLEMHAYVRMKLVKLYGEEVVKPDGPIAAHLLGNMWGENWNHLQDITRPFPDKQDVAITPEMVRRSVSEDSVQKVTAIQMFKISEDFFTSLGMKRMTPEFWHYSVLEKQELEPMECYTISWDMCADDDFRIWHCTVPMQEDMPDVFQWGANPGFHEAIGDALEMSVVTPKHIHKISFLDKVENDTEAEINSLMSMALEKIAFLPFGYLIDLWRWDVFRGSVDNLNDRWWQLRQKYLWLCPPVRRSETDFDPGVKYHVPSNTPYIRHFFSFILQFQLQEVLCREAGHVGPLHTCDIYGSHAAGEKLAGLLRLGRSMPWQDALARMTGGSCKLDARPLLNYFSPLRRHIRDSLGNSTVGWTSGDHNICP